MNPKKLYLIGVGIGLLVGIVIILLVAKPSTPAPTIDPAAFTSWVTVTPESGLFTAAFPASPTRVTNDLPVAESTASIIQDLYSATDARGSIYYVATFLYPQSFPTDDPEGLLRVALDGMLAAAPGGELTVTEFAPFKNLPALDFAIELENGIVHQGKLILKDRVLYQLFVTYDTGALEDNAFYYFQQAFVVR